MRFTSPRFRQSTVVNEQMHRQLREILDRVAPEWQRHLRIVPYANACACHA
jgi:hypothetical protein